MQLETSYNQFLSEGWPAFQERFNRDVRIVGTDNCSAGSGLVRD